MTASKRVTLLDGTGANVDCGRARRRPAIALEIVQAESLAAVVQRCVSVGRRDLKTGAYERRVSELMAES